MAAGALRAETHTRSASPPRMSVKTHGFILAFIVGKSDSLLAAVAQSALLADLDNDPDKPNLVVARVSNIGGDICSLRKFIPKNALNILGIIDVGINSMQ